MYQEVAFLAGSTEHQFTSFHFKPPGENPQEVSSKKGLVHTSGPSCCCCNPSSATPPARRTPPGRRLGLPLGHHQRGRHQVPHPLANAGRVPLTRLGRLRGLQQRGARRPSATSSPSWRPASAGCMREMCALSFQEELLYWGVEGAEPGLDEGAREGTACGGGGHGGEPALGRPGEGVPCLSVVFVAITRHHAVHSTCRPPGGRREGESLTVKRPVV
ncbi:unnamed protein product [Boreogadus saida]